jgi:hypothetical protein
MKVTGNKATRDAIRPQWRLSWPRCRLPAVMRRWPQAAAFLMGGPDRTGGAVGTIHRQKKVKEAREFSYLVE